MFTLSTILFTSNSYLTFFSPFVSTLSASVCQLTNKLCHKPFSKIKKLFLSVAIYSVHQRSSDIKYSRKRYRRISLRQEKSGISQLLPPLLPDFGITRTKVARRRWTKLQKEWLMKPKSNIRFKTQHILWLLTSRALIIDYGKTNRDVFEESHRVHLVVFKS